ncbi:hypothetical protein SADUNF_Sadunf12G0012500 [Salix dunnii]|uniref:Uncharacterized protein n=1 Tax=Salix dunnii TaxID=1413687 RepID=A0A835JH28_9ROSI|nr:hypothetical protein SADUNF_Sadunf12G0012500 [Salix dunnii]
MSDDFNLVFILLIILMLRLSHSMIENVPSEQVKDVCNESKELMAKIYGILKKMMHVLEFFKWMLENPQQLSPPLIKSVSSKQFPAQKYTSFNKEFAQCNICCFTETSSDLFILLLPWWLSEDGLKTESYATMTTTRIISRNLMGNWQATRLTS